MTSTARQDHSADSVLCVALSGATLQEERVVLNANMALARTYVHLSGPMIAAFSPAPPGKHHPAPWRAVHGGAAFDAHVQFSVSRTFAQSLVIGEQGLVWLIVALLRLRIGTALIAPLVGNEPFEGGKTNERIGLWSHEVEQPLLRIHDREKPEITREDSEWIEHHWQDAMRLVMEEPKYALLLEAVDGCAFARREPFAMVWLWGALEGLFSSGRDELRFRVASSIAAFLEPPGEGRVQLQRRVMKLYDSRSAAAHGRKEQAGLAVAESYALGRRVVLKLTTDGHVPSREDLEAMLFGGPKDGER